MTPPSNAILDRIIAVKKLKNDAALARTLNIKPAIISNWRTRGTIPYDTLLTLSQQDGITLDYLINGRGPIYAADSIRGQAYEDHLSDQDNKVREKPFYYNARSDQFLYISQVAGKISAGRGLEPENAVDVKIAFRKEWITRKGDPGNMVLIKVDGDSMEPSLLAGDLVLVDRNRNYIDPQGGIYALALDDNIMVKRVQAMKGKIKIISDNPKYQPFEVPPDAVKVNGKIIWFARELGR